MHQACQRRPAMHRQLRLSRQIFPLVLFSVSQVFLSPLSSLLNSSRMHCTVVGGCWMHCVGWDRGCWWGSCTARRQQSAAVNRGQLLLLPRTFLVLYLSVFMQISLKHFVSSFRSCWKIDLNVSWGRFAEGFPRNLLLVHIGGHAKVSLCFTLFLASVAIQVRSIFMLLTNRKSSQICSCWC